MGIDGEAKRAWKEGRTLGNKLVENTAFLKFVQSCLDNNKLPSIVDLSDIPIPANFTQGTEMIPEPELAKVWKKALKDASTLLLNSVKSMGELKATHLDIKLKAADLKLNALTPDQDILAKVKGIRTQLVNKHGEEATKKSDARLQRLLSSGSDRPKKSTQPSQSTQPQGGQSNPTPGTSGQGQRSTQGFRQPHAPRPPSRQGTPKGSPRGTPRGGPRPPKRPRGRTPGPSAHPAPTVYQEPQYPPMPPPGVMPPWAMYMPPPWMMYPHNNRGAGLQPPRGPREQKKRPGPRRA